jgi:hypothetical protein
VAGHHHQLAGVAAMSSSVSAARLTKPVQLSPPGAMT